MSITVRLYSKSELQSIKDGTADKNLITTFMNGITFSEDEIKYCPYELRKIYEAYFYNEEEPRTIYACNEESLMWFLKQEYNTEYVDAIFEKTITLREIPLNFK
jgi:hypothetical protein